MIRLSRPTLGEPERRAVADVLASGMLVQGEQVARFEGRVATACARTHGVAVASGTSALHLALLALGIGEGDEVLVPNLTWPSPAHAVRLTGATPVLVEVDANEWNAAAEHFVAARSSRTRAAIVIDQFGNPARCDEIRNALADVTILEDAACALGGSFGAQPCGSMGAIACISFHPRKIITTGEGGMCVTDDDALASRLRTLRNHGQASPGQFVEPSSNHRLTEVAAAIGLAQMDRLEEMIETRRVLALRYVQALPQLTFQSTPPGARTNHQTMGALLPQSLRSSRDKLLGNMRARGVEVGTLSYALHRLPTMKEAADDARRAGRSFDISEDIVDRGIALPLHSEIGQAEQDTVIRCLQEELEVLAR